MVSQVEAVVLRHADYQESDRIVTTFTRERGKLVARARGVRRSVKRFPGRLDLFTHVHLSLFEGRGAPRFDGAELIDAHLPMREDLLKLAMAGALAELTEQLFGEGEPHPGAFETLCAALTWLDREGREEWTWIAVARLLDEAGLRPRLDGCVECGRPVVPGEHFHFEAAAGGVLCLGCSGEARGRQVDLGTLKLVSQGLELPVDRVPRLVCSPTAGAQVRWMMVSFVRYHVREGLRALGFWMSLLEGGRP